MRPFGRGSEGVLYGFWVEGSALRIWVWVSGFMFRALRTFSLIARNTVCLLARLGSGARGPGFSSSESFDAVETSSNATPA